MARTEQSLHELKDFDADPSPKEQEVRKRQAEFDVAGNDDSKRPIQY